MEFGNVRKCDVCEKPSIFKCGRCEKAYYCSVACQKKDWPKHKLVCKLNTDLIIDMEKVYAFINQNPRIWLGTLEVGDRDLINSEYLLIQRSLDFTEDGQKLNGITVQVIGVPERLRRQGRTTKMLDLIERAARARGLDFIILQSVSSPEMLQLVRNRHGYTRHRDIERAWDYPGDFIIKL